MIMNHAITRRPYWIGQHSGALFTDCAMNKNDCLARAFVAELDLSAVDSICRQTCEFMIVSFMLHFTPRAPEYPRIGSLR